MTMLKIGVTGNIGAGKSMVCSIFELLDIPVYNADHRAKSLMMDDPDLVKAIKELLGKEAYDKSGQLNRAYVSGKVFKDRKILDSLNGLVHPAVARDFDRWVGQQNAAYCIKEAALLFEAGSYRQLDKTILVTADEDVRLHRVMSRDGFTEQEVRDRMDKQMSQEKKMEMADYIIENNGDIGLVSQVLRLHALFLGLNH